MEKLLQINQKLAKIRKLDKLQVLIYPMILFGLLVGGIFFMEVIYYLNKFVNPV